MSEAKNLGRFTMADDQAKLHNEQAGLKWRGSANAHTKEIERSYRGRLVRALEGMGIGPVAVTGENDPVDLYIDGKAIEIKIARARERPRGDGFKPRPEYYQALLWDHANGHFLDGDLVVMICVDRSDRLWPFVIPRAAIEKRRTIEITSAPENYQGRWAPYLGRLDLLQAKGVES